MRVQGKNYGEVGQDVLQRFHSWVTSGKGGEEWSLEEENHEGWRVSVDEGDGKFGWLLLRASLHDPLLVLNTESEITGGEAGVHMHPPAIAHRLVGHTRSKTWTLHHVSMCMCAAPSQGERMMWWYLAGAGACVEVAESGWIARKTVL